MQHSRLRRSFKTAANVYSTASQYTQILEGIEREQRGIPKKLLTDYTRNIENVLKVLGESDDPNVRYMFILTHSMLTGLCNTS
ncbi:hypothetical protein J4221_07210 [Candidatus Pacearchaeota archaeon]|nr:hypothetical protein [Candidatus Pacearchaeota archaeon]